MIIKLRKKNAKINFENEFSMLMNKEVFGKSVKNVRKLEI